MPDGSVRDKHVCPGCLNAVWALFGIEPEPDPGPDPDCVRCGHDASFHNAQRGCVAAVDGAQCGCVLLDDQITDKRWAE
jgi:hypothetical protein